MIEIEQLQQAVPVGRNQVARIGALQAEILQLLACGSMNGREWVHVLRRQRWFRQIGDLLKRRGSDVLFVNTGNRRVAEFAHHFGNHFREIAGSWRAVRLKADEMQHAIRQFAGQKGIWRPHQFGDGEQGAGDAIGLERNKPTVARQDGSG